MIDDKLHWTPHLKLCKAKLSSSLFAIKSAKNVLPKKLLRTLYYALMYPYIDYGIMLWGAAAKSLIKPLEVLQKKAIRNIMGTNYKTPTLPLFKELRILSFQDVFNLNMCKFMYDYHQRTLPDPLNDIFTDTSNIHEHFTRQASAPHVKVDEQHKLIG